MKMNVVLNGQAFVADQIEVRQPKASFSDPLWGGPNVQLPSTMHITAKSINAKATLNPRGSKQSIDMNNPVAINGGLWQATDFEFGRDDSMTVRFASIVRPAVRSKRVTDQWTGRKYRGASTGFVYIVLGEPFKVDGIDYVTYQTQPGAKPACEQTRYFEGSTSYTRIIEPRYKVGDRVVIECDVYTIEAVSTKPDKDGDFLYIIDHPEGIDHTWESFIDRKADA
jgi:hypothetical protein